MKPNVPNLRGREAHIHILFIIKEIDVLNNKKKKMLKQSIKKLYLINMNLFFVKESHK